MYTNLTLNLIKNDTYQKVIQVQTTSNGSLSRVIGKITPLKANSQLKN